MINPKKLTLTDKVLLAALKLSKGSINEKFTAEDLLIESWKIDKASFGLRNYEEDYPDSNNLYTKLMGKSGLVRTGYLRKVNDKTYTLTEAGLSIASGFHPDNTETKIRADRTLNNAVTKIINHQVFSDWLKNKDNPRKFRDAMWFWGIAPGIPPNVVKERLVVIDKNLQEAKKRAEECGGKLILDSNNLSRDVKSNLSKYNPDEDKNRFTLSLIDIERCMEFNESLKIKFKKDLKEMLNEH